MAMEPISMSELISSLERKLPQEELLKQLRDLLEEQKQASTGSKGSDVLDSLLERLSSQKSETTSKETSHKTEDSKDKLPQTSDKQNKSE